MVLVLVILALPFTRYPVLGLFMKQNLDVVVQDSSTNKPVSNATVAAAGATAQTDVNGKASLHVKLGKAILKIQKSYYKDFSQNVTVGLTRPGAVTASIEATGRQVPITVNNKITNKPLAGVRVKAADSEATTDAKGQATIVLPADKATVDAVVTASGYNDAKAKITVTDKQDNANTLTITPAGKVYFLSKASGKVDVVKANLDGTSRKTVLAGTGKEDSRDTILLASKDWKYLALKTRRDGSHAKLYVINTSTDKYSDMDQGDAVFNMDGWVGHYFVYSVDRNHINYNKPGQSALKSYNADSGALKTLDQTTATGTSNSNYATETFGSVYPLNSVIVYNKSWNYSYTAPGLMHNRSLTVNSIKPDGSSKAVLKTFKAYDSATDTVYFLSGVAYESGGIYYSLTPGTAVYKYEGGQVAKTTAVTQDDLNNNDYPTYLLSPDDKKTFWADPRDGKNTLFVGDTNGDHGKQIATLSDYAPYGWFTNDYLLVSKDSSELYIMSVSAGKPVKITDYHKPAVRFYGYGGGYGGI